MKRLTLISAVLLLFAAPACNKQEQGIPEPERELSTAEKVEKEILDIASKPWKSLADTLNYFNSTMLSKGRVKGIAPDGVYYELETSIRSVSGLEASFKVRDSVWASIRGNLSPAELELDACESEITIKQEKDDSCSLSASNVKVIAPLLFFLKKGHRSALIYKNERVGWLTREEFENTDYSTGTYIVIHYYNDPRSFAIFDNGLGQLFKDNLPYVFR